MHYSVEESLQLLGRPHLSTLLDLIMVKRAILLAFANESSSSKILRAI